MSNLHLKKEAWAWMDLRRDNGACFMHTAQQVHLHYQACFMQFFLFWAFTPISWFAKHGLRGLCCVCFFFLPLSMMLVTLNVMRSNHKLLQLSQKCSAQKRNECTINTSCAIMGHCVWNLVLDWLWYVPSISGLRHTWVFKLCSEIAI